MDLIDHLKGIIGMFVKIRRIERTFQNHRYTSADIGISRNNVYIRSFA